MTSSIDWTTRPLRHGKEVYTAQLPEALLGEDQASFERWWALHPEEYNTIMMHGRPVALPRWQRAYGHDYRFSGTISHAEPLTDEMRRLLDWTRQAIDPRLNGLLLNWYDGALGHYIGAHRDSTRGLIAQTPIVTVSLGEQRAFRMRRRGESGFEDFLVGHGDLLLIPWDTNLDYTHEVPRSKRYTGRRVSITIRAFEGE